MSSAWQGKGLSRLIGVGICIASLAASANSQAGFTREESKPAIDLKLSSSSLMVCVGSSLLLNLELTNRGTTEFKVDKFDIWNRFTYGYLGDRDTGRGGGSGSSCIHCQANFLTLKPDGTYQSSFDFSLGDEFFKDAGKYTMALTIAGISSNELEFELFNCR